MLAGQLRRNPLFRWLVRLRMNDQVRRAAVSTKNRNRLLDGETARAQKSSPCWVRIQGWCCAEPPFMHAAEGSIWMTAEEPPGGQLWQGSRESPASMNCKQWRSACLAQAEKKPYRSAAWGRCETALRAAKNREAAVETCPEQRAEVQRRR